jgi:predicted AAA+ superfamily ATPase
MPHSRNRHISSLLKHVAKLSPLIGVLGHRQVGKTTLLEEVSHTYRTLDDDETLKEALNHPKRFLEETKSLATAIDECQLAETLFPALKERVRVDKRPGQFYLSGSVRFTSKKLIQESLTGRIISFDLLPMTLSELNSHELPDWFEVLAKVNNFESFTRSSITAGETKKRKKLIDQYLVQGGLPGVCFIREERLRSEKILSQLETIMNRDLRQVHNTSLTYRELIQFVRYLASQDGQPYNFQETRRRTGVSPITQKKLLFALESVFLIRQLPCEGDLKGFSLFFEDQAEALVLSQKTLSTEQQWIGLIYRNIREQFNYRLGSNAEYFQYRTRGGVIIPIAIRTDHVTWGIIAAEEGVTRQVKAASDSFLREYPEGKVLIVSRTDQLCAIERRILQIPATRLLFVS